MSCILHHLDEMLETVRPAIKLGESVPHSGAPVLGDTATLSSHTSHQGGFIILSVFYLSFKSEMDSLNIFLNSSPSKGRVFLLQEALMET